MTNSASVENPRPILPSVLSIAIILIITIAALHPVLKCDFTTWDDAMTVSGNNLLKPPSLGGIKYFWTHAAMGLYVPITYTFWSAVAFLCPEPLLPSEPMKLDPALFHGANLLIHVCSAIIVWAALRRIFKGRINVPGIARVEIAACSAALLFVLHPVQVESVAWVSGSKDLLAGFFSLLAIWQYIGFVDAPRASTERLLRYLIVLGAAGFAMLSKPSAMVLPAILLIVDALILRRSIREIAQGIIPVFLICLPCTILSIVIQHPHRDLAIWQRPVVVLDSLSFYIRKLFWPTKLAPDYGRRPGDFLHTPAIWFCWLLPAAAAIVLWLIRKKTPPVVAGGLIFVVGVLPVLGFVSTLFSEKSTVADHYLYLAMFGIALSAGTILARFANPTVYAAAGIVLAVFGGMSFLQTYHWGNTFALFSHTISVAPRSWAGHGSLAQVYFEQKKFPEAEFHRREAVRIFPSSVNHRGLGELLLLENRPAEAIESLQKALEIEPGLDRARCDLADALMHVGRSSDAIAELKRALAERPDDARAKSLLRAAERGRP